MKKIRQKSESIKNNHESNVRSYSEELEFLRSSAVVELRRRGYEHAAVEKPIERQDGRLVYVKAYARGSDGLPSVAVECFTEVSGRVSRRAVELREVLPGHSIVLVFPERLAPEAAKYAGCGDEVWLVSSDGEVECYAGGDVEGLKTHLRNKVTRRALQAREEIKELMREYEAARRLLKTFSKGIVYTQAPLRALFALSAKLVLGDRFYPELANIPFLGPYHERVIEYVRALRELRGKISEKIVEVADEILKIETEYGIERMGESRGNPIYHVREVREEENTRDGPLIPPLEHLAERYMEDCLEDVKRYLELQASRQPTYGIHSYIMDEVAKEIKERAEKSKNAKREKRQADKPITNTQDEYITVSRKTLEKILEKIGKIEKSLETLQETV